jgi:hypothetical protein
MVKRLSEQLSDLSVHVKNAEDAASAAEKEAHDKIAARKEQARAAVKTAIERVNQEVKSAGDSAARDWNAVKAKIADRLEWEAGFAIDYAVASVEQASLAVLDAIAGRRAAEQAKRT